ncbi:Imm70 family immunity protein [Micromonospora sp. C28SCA-DRY-2]|uniref:Imm70 family immunity protein n=1 Tax=Micromonospora sp. C28SCA-DRY-2 TaxID=3059522 RepID=UPI002676DCC5|nr:Imm70 family immunity protein [Micromonospora sp. C28SCA-DRY-2]MDO3700956.1 Imm70 family immunity protein [Micromonospora sp. C28SCA-DRY-2]
MGLYLCVFADDRVDDETDGVEVGSYADFNRLRQTVADHLEGGAWGSRFPVLMGHDDSDGTWGPEEAAQLEQELLCIADEFARLPPVDVASGWQADVVRRNGNQPRSLLESFVDVDGEFLLERLVDLARTAVTARMPICFP